MDATAQTPDLDSLRRLVEAEELRGRLAAAQFATRALVGARDSQVMEGWGDLVDPTDYLRGDPSYDLSAGRQLYPSARLGDRADGRNYPIVQTEEDLLLIRGTARLLCDTSPAAIGVMSALKNYIVGSGFDFKAIARTGAETSQGLPAAVQAFVDGFLDANNFQGDLDREFLQRSRRDGEVFVAKFPQSDGNTLLRIVEPEQITEPRTPRDIEDALEIDVPSNWTFGVHTEARDIQNVLGYYVQWNASGSDWDYLPACNVEHCKLNVDRNIKRGISDFYPVRPYLEQAEKLLRNTAMGAAAQAAIAFIREHVPGTQQGQIESMRATNSTGTFQRTQPSGASITRFNQRMEPGTVLDASPGMKLTPGPSGGGDVIGGYISIEQAILRYAGMRWNMAEYMISGDASNGSYASTLVAESPFVRFVESEQNIYRKHFGKTVWAAIKHACACGWFAAFGVTSFAVLRRLIDLQITPPNVGVRDELKATQANMILNAGGVMSPSTWAARSGLDYAQEVKLGAKPKATPKSPLTIDDPTPRATPTTEGMLESDSPFGRLARAARFWRGYP